MYTVYLALRKSRQSIWLLKLLICCLFRPSVWVSRQSILQLRLPPVGLFRASVSLFHLSVEVSKLLVSPRLCGCSNGLFRYIGRLSVRVLPFFVRISWLSGWSPSGCLHIHSGCLGNLKSVTKRNSRGCIQNA